MRFFFDTVNTIIASPSIISVPQLGVLLPKPQVLMDFVLVPAALVLPSVRFLALPVTGVVVVGGEV